MKSQRSVIWYPVNVIWNVIYFVTLCCHCNLLTSCKYIWKIVTFSSVFRYSAILKNTYFRDGLMDIFCGLPTSISYNILLKHAVHQTKFGWLQQCWLRMLWFEMKLKHFPKCFVVTPEIGANIVLIAIVIFSCNHVGHYDYRRQLNQKIHQRNKVSSSKLCL